MSVTILSGEDTLSLDKFYIDYRQKFSEVEPLENFDRIILQNKLSSQGFFATTKLYVFRNIFLNQVKVGKVSLKLNESLVYLASLKDEALLFIESDSNKIKYYQKYFPQAAYKEFKVSPYLFYFLDHFKPNGTEKCFNYWQKAKEKTAPELVLFMLRRRIRELLMVKSGTLKTNIQPWQIGKLKAQAGEWEEKKLLRVYKALFQYEKGLKSGTNPLTTEQALDTILTLYV